jgi:hypothetical protein
VIHVHPVRDRDIHAFLQRVVGTGPGPLLGDVELARHRSEIAHRGALDADAERRKKLVEEAVHMIGVV